MLNHKINYMLNDFDDRGCNIIYDNLFSLFNLSKITLSVSERTKCNTMKLSDFAVEKQYSNSLSYKSRRKRALGSVRCIKEITQRSF